VSYPRKITRNVLIQWFSRFSVEIIEEKIHEKVIHSPFISPCAAPVTRDFGGTPVAQINS
jgi:hypothetical protein